MLLFSHFVKKSLDSWTVFKTSLLFGLHLVFLSVDMADLVCSMLLYSTGSIFFIAVSILVDVICGNTQGLLAA